MIQGVVYRVLYRECCSGLVLSFAVTARFSERTGYGFVEYESGLDYW
jgi:hypothetical protein